MQNLIKLAVIVGTWMWPHILKHQKRDPLTDSSVLTVIPTKQVCVCLHAIWKMKFTECKRTHYELNMLYNRWRALK